jgi:hypothetical protein
MAARESIARCRVGAGRGDVRHRSTEQSDGEARSRDRAHPRQSGHCLTRGRVALRGDARSMPALRPRLSRALAGASTAPWHRGARSVHAGGNRRRGDVCGGGRDRPSLALRAEFFTVSEAHQVAVPHSLKVQAPKRISNPAGRGSELPME